MFLQRGVEAPFPRSREPRAGPVHPPGDADVASGRSREAGEGSEACDQTTRKRDKTRGQRGQTMTEFAIVLPIFLLLLLGIAQGGIAFNNYVQLTDALAPVPLGAPLG